MSVAENETTVPAKTKPAAFFVLLVMAKV